MKGYLYRITNKINGKSYIGQTIQSPKKRWSEHCRNSSACKYLFRAIQKYGRDNFLFEVILTIKGNESTKLRKFLNTMEIGLIAEFNTLSPNGYNILKSGSGALGRKWKNSPFEGRKHTEESKRKIAAANFGMKRPWMQKHAAKMTQSKKRAVVCNETGQVWSSIKECAESFGVKPEAIHRVLRGKRKHFRKLTFDYAKQS